MPLNRKRKAGVVDALKRDWKRAAIVNVVFLVFIIDDAALFRRCRTGEE